MKSDISCNKLFKDTKAVIWDWNGTLLDDLDVSIAAMNMMLQKRSYPKLEVDRYKAIFTFPVRKYYEAAGMNFNDYEWDDVAMEFIRNYRDKVPLSGLHGDAGEMLDFFRQKGFRQFILSAMQQGFLEETIEARLNPAVFEKIIGLNDHYAATKLENATMLIESLELENKEMVMIGDTLHDFEVAAAAGIPCVLVACGHQSRQRLIASGARVVENLSALKDLF